MPYNPSFEMMSGREGRKEGQWEVTALMAVLIKADKSDLLPKLEEPKFLEKMMKEYL